MEIHIGNVIRNAIYMSNIPPSVVAKEIGLHKSSISRLYAYESVQTEMLTKLSLVLKYDFYLELSESLNLKKVVIDTTSATEKLLTESKAEVASLKKEILYLEEINQLLRKK